MYNLLTGGLIFYLLSTPFANQLTNRVIGHYESKCPSMYTRILHAILYTIVLLFLMAHFAYVRVSNSKTVLVSAVSGLLFFFLASPDLYAATNRLFRLGSDPSCPSATSILLHTVVFMLISHYLMCFSDRY
jgi:hypothetical protein